jgi:hypothetical protein
MDVFTKTRVRRRCDALLPTESRLDVCVAADRVRAGARPHTILVNPMTTGLFRTPLALGLCLAAAVFALVAAPMAHVQHSSVLIEVQRTVVSETAREPAAPPAAPQKFKAGYVEFED